MKVIQVLPGGGWYSKILLTYLGTDGELVGADFAASLYPDADDELIEEMDAWPEAWPKAAEEWRSPDSAAVSAYLFGDSSKSVSGTADAVLFIRALHGIASIDDEFGSLDTGSGRFI